MYLIFCFEEKGLKIENFRNNSSAVLRSISIIIIIIIIVIIIKRFQIVLMKDVRKLVRFLQCFIGGKCHFNTLKTT